MMMISFSNLIEIVQFMRETGMLYKRLAAIFSQMRLSRFSISLHSYILYSIRQLPFCS